MHHSLTKLALVLGISTLGLACATSTADNSDGGNGGGGPDAQVAAAAFATSPVLGSPTEDGAAASFQVSLSRAPTADVTMSVTSSDQTEGTTDVASLTFTSANWSMAQTVTVTGVDDDLVDGDQPFQVIVGSVSSDDLEFGVLRNKNVALINVDNDVVGIAVADNSGTTTEGGGVATFTLALVAPPSANVVVNLVNGDATEGTIDQAAVVFTPASWAVPQTVTVTGQNDDVDDGDIGYEVLFASIVSLDTDYAGLTPAPIALINIDNDTAGITVGAISGHTSESGSTATFTVVLDSEPTAAVTVNFAGNDPTEGALSVTALAFNTTNWNQPRTVVVTGLVDGIVDGDITYQVVFQTTTSADALYAAITPASFNVVNDDSRGCLGWPGDNFEDGSITDWTIGSGYSASSSTLAGANGTNRGLLFTGGSAHYSGLRKTFAAAQPSYMSIWMQADGSTGNNRSYLVLGDANTATNAGILFMYAYTGTGRWRIYSSPTSVDGPTIVAGRWYHFEFGFNWVAKTFSVKVDGTLYSAAVPFRTPSSVNVSQLHLYNFTNSSTARYDEILMECN